MASGAEDKYEVTFYLTYKHVVSIPWRGQSPDEAIAEARPQVDGEFFGNCHLQFAGVAFERAQRMVKKYIENQKTSQRP